MYKEIGLALFGPACGQPPDQGDHPGKGRDRRHPRGHRRPAGHGARPSASATRSFTTSFHTKLAEYINERTGIPARRLWRWLEGFPPACAAGAGDNQVWRTSWPASASSTPICGRAGSIWSCSTSKKPLAPRRRLAAPGVRLVGRRRGGEEYRELPQLDLPGTKCASLARGRP